MKREDREFRAAARFQLEQLMRDYNLRVVDVVRLTGLTRSTIQRYRRGKLKVPYYVMRLIELEMWAAKMVRVNNPEVLFGNEVYDRVWEAVCKDG